jgi:transcriptional regulator with XRE-family HTH domain
MSQRELARRTGLSRETVARAERGQGAITVATARRLAGELGVGLGALFGTSASDRSDAMEALREASRR